MSEIPMETRVGIVEHQIRTLLSMQKQVQETHDKVFELGVLLEAHIEKPECPAPGKCLALDVRLTKLEIKAAENRGGWKIVAAISALLAGLVTWMLNHFTTKHP